MSNIEKSIYFQERGEAIQQRIPNVQKGVFQNAKAFCFNQYFHPFSLFLMFATAAVNLFLFNFSVVENSLTWSFFINAIEFWMFKNIYGRKMAGLKWSRGLNSKNESCWRYEGWIQDRDKKLFLQEFSFWGLQIFQLVWMPLTVISDTTKLIWGIGQSVLTFFNLWMFYKTMRHRRQHVFELIEKKGYDFLLKHHDHSLVMLIS